MKYSELKSFLIHYYQDFLTVKIDYIVIRIPNQFYHITIYQDQWDDYMHTTNRPYHLFHISSNNKDTRCSSYFWINVKTLKIQKIPRGLFLYNQPSYSFDSSTRNPCPLANILDILKFFQKILNIYKKIEKNR